jgi:H3 lysine-79-specific histone-lysine N-methyltransferase
LSTKENQTFLDLGSGIGNVVLQVAMQTRCKSYGIELLEIPHMFARAQLAEYRARMLMYGRAATTIHLSKGDFLESERVHKIIKRVDILFVNNYAFESDVNHRLMQLFLEMREGAVIISFRSFRPVDYKITEHNMNDIASILAVEKVG